MRSPVCRLSPGLPAVLRTMFRTGPWPGLSTSIIMYSPDELSLAWLIGGAAAAAVMSLVSVRAHLLTARGGAAQFLLGWLLIGLGGLPWVLPILSFFVSSSIISRWSAARRPEVHAMFSKGSTRDHWQVIANGGLAGALVIIASIDSHPAWFAAYAGACAAAAADTWGTEIGVLSRSRPRLLLSMRPVAPGSSGAVSALGITGSLLGAALVGSVSHFFSPEPGSSPGMLTAVGGGLVGATVDSLAGARLQARFRCQICGASTEGDTHCGMASTFEAGIPWMSNDAVNVACTVAGGLTAGLLHVVVPGW